MPRIAKLATHRPLATITRQPGVDHADLWLDDISLDLSHPDPEVAASLALAASRKLEALLLEEHLIINKSKTKFVVNNSKAAQALRSMSTDKDPQIAESVKDLGGLITIV